MLDVRQPDQMINKHCRVAVYKICEIADMFNWHFDLSVQSQTDGLRSETERRVSWEGSRQRGKDAWQPRCCKALLENLQKATLQIKELFEGRVLYSAMNETVQCSKFCVTFQGRAMDVSEQIKCEDHVLSSVSLFCGENKTFVPSPVEEITFSAIFVPLCYAKHIYHTLDLYPLILTHQLNDLIKTHMKKKKKLSDGGEIICSLVPCTHVRPVLLCCD